MSTDRLPHETSRRRNPYIGAVIIGRNEGDRLEACLSAVRSTGIRVVYVDSGSTDNSLKIAASHSCEIIHFGSDQKFSAAAARNAGFRRLLELDPKCEFVQFVDGDCEVNPGWIGTAAGFLLDSPSYAVACGRRRERFPQRSIYNRLCDVEWDTPVGDAASCGGDALFRVEALREVGLYNPTFIAGEEPELCSRLLEAGWGVMRLAHEMTLHDASITRFGQWWRRSVRAGWGYINGYAHVPTSGLRRWRRETIRPWIFCVLLPIGSLMVIQNFGSGGTLLLTIYAVPIVRATLNARRRGSDLRTALFFGVLTLVGKFAELQGQLTWLRDRSLRRHSTLIEYKTAD